MCKGAARSLMFLLNTCVLLAGAAMIAVGVLAIIEWPEYEYIFKGETTIYKVSIVTVVTGSLLFLVGFSGCVGACRESTCLLSSYIFFTMLLAILQIACGVLILLYSGDVETKLSGKLTSAFGEYDEDDDAKNAVDYIQRKHECCGLDGPDYWNNNTFTIPPDEEAGLPESCQSEDEVQYTEGCIDAFEKYISYVCNLLGGISIGFLLFDIIGMGFACSMITTLKHNAISPE
ncbi:23 kDa integral membrane protein-like [Anneissia japonica]|uniref:23 kDa integral membrane protein-like n=1 Tax=Anneissia japonica TaxID=1529436 RepID=UPI0014255BBD|nr:23 kDa integral membrane protein-like [Anneissia japonica]